MSASSRNMIPAGVSFDGNHCLTYYGLTLQPYTIPLPEPKYAFVDLPGGNGSADLTEESGEVLYQDRVFTLTFQAIDRERRFEQIAAALANDIHGKRVEIIFDRDPLYHYDARCRVISVVPKGPLATITVEVIAKPFRFKNTQTYMTVSLNEMVTTIELTNDRAPVNPSVTVSAKCYIRMSNGTVLELPEAGTYVLYDLILHEGTNSILVGKSNEHTAEALRCTFFYNEGRL